MPKNIKVKQHKALEEAELKELGRINVVCGRNSSGKSTLLEGIFEGKISIGLMFSEKEQLLFSDRFNKIVPAEGYRFSSSQSPKQYIEPFSESVAQLIKENPVLFIEDKQDFIERLLYVFEAKTNHVSFEPDNVANVFEYIFNQIRKPEIALLPPKRILKSIESNELRKSAGQNGEWLLNALFHAKNQLRNHADYKLFHSIKENFSEISGGFNFDIISESEVGTSKSLVALQFAYGEEGNWVGAADCGLGLRDLLVILYFAVSPDFDVVLIEEPENHIHPEMQRKLLRFLRENTEKQYFIATHSNVYLNSTYVDRVFYSEYVKGKVEIRDATSKAKVLHSLGYSVSDNLVSDLIVLVEGSGDKDFLEEFIKKLGLDAEFNIKTWILGGDEMVNQDLSVFAQDYKIIALVDKDSEGAVSNSARTEFSENCEKNAIHLHTLERYSLESYFPINALNETFNKYDEKLPEITGLDEEALRRKIKNSPIWKRLDPTPQRQKEIKRMLKRKVRDIAQLMTVDDLEGTDLQKFFEKMNTILQDGELELGHS